MPPLSGQKIDTDLLKDPSGMRRTPRRSFNRPAGVLYGGNFAIYTVPQIGEGGLLFRSSERLQTGRMVVVSLLLPGSFAVTARGKILYENKDEKGGNFQYGVEFVPLSLQLRRKIRNFVSAADEPERIQK